MHGSKPRPFLVAIFIFIIHSLFHTCQAEILSDHLDVITSGNPGSNAIQSFVIIKQGKL